MADKEDGASAPVTIKKYANRRLYNTATSSYVTLDSLCLMVKNGIDFVVFDAKTGEDITHPVLTQIIIEEESKGQNLLPVGFLRQLIGFYGDSMQWMVPRYLEFALQSFVRNQQHMRGYFQTTLNGMFSVDKVDDAGDGSAVHAAPASAAPQRTQAEPTLEDVLQRIDALQQQVAIIARRAE